MTLLLEIRLIVETAYRFIYRTSSHIKKDFEKEKKDIFLG